MIGAINGYAITGGLELALSCDFLFASENAVFADTHTGVICPLRGKGTATRSRSIILSTTKIENGALTYYVANSFLL